jgi:Flp pilus assembly protein TadD
MTGRVEAAAKSLESSKGLPPSVHAWLLAQVEVERSRLAEALAALDRVAELAPQFVTARILRGRVLHRLGRAEEAEQALRAVLAEHRATSTS